MIILLHVNQSTGSSAKLTGFCMEEGLYKLYQASFPHKYYTIHLGLIIFKERPLVGAVLSSKKVNASTFSNP